MTPSEKKLTEKRQEAECLHRLASDLSGSKAGENDPALGSVLTELTELEAEIAELTKKVARNRKRNRASRARHQAMRDLGMTKTPYGWE